MVDAVRRTFASLGAWRSPSEAGSLPASPTKGERALQFEVDEPCGEAGHPGNGVKDPSVTATPPHTPLSDEASPELREKLEVRRKSMSQAEKEAARLSAVLTVPMLPCEFGEDMKPFVIGSYVQVLKTGRVGIIIKDDGTSTPYKVAFEDGIPPFTDWFAREDVGIVPDPEEEKCAKKGMEAKAPEAFGDEGAASQSTAGESPKGQEGVVTDDSEEKEGPKVPARGDDVAAHGEEQSMEESPRGYPASLDLIPAERREGLTPNESRAEEDKLQEVRELISLADIGASGNPSIPALRRALEDRGASNGGSPCVRPSNATPPCELVSGSILVPTLPLPLEPQDNDAIVTTAAATAEVGVGAAILSSVHSPGTAASVNSEESHSPVTDMRSGPTSPVELLRPLSEGNELASTPEVLQSASPGSGPSNEFKAVRSSSQATDSANQLPALRSSPKAAAASPAGAAAAVDRKTPSPQPAAPLPKRSASPPRAKSVGKARHPTSPPSKVATSLPASSSQPPKASSKSSGQIVQSGKASAPPKALSKAGPRAAASSTPIEAAAPLAGGASEHSRAGLAPRANPAARLSAQASQRVAADPVGPKQKGAAPRASAPQQGQVTTTDGSEEQGEQERSDRMERKGKGKGPKGGCSVGGGKAEKCQGPPSPEGSHFDFRIAGPPAKATNGKGAKARGERSRMPASPGKGLASPGQGKTKFDVSSSLTSPTSNSSDDFIGRLEARSRSSSRGGPESPSDSAVYGRIGSDGDGRYSPGVAYYFEEEYPDPRRSRCASAESFLESRAGGRGNGKGQGKFSGRGCSSGGGKTMAVQPPLGSLPSHGDGLEAGGGRGKGSPWQRVRPVAAGGTLTPHAPWSGPNGLAHSHGVYGDAAEQWAQSQSSQRARSETPQRAGDRPRGVSPLGGRQRPGLTAPTSNGITTGLAESAAGSASASRCATASSPIRRRSLTGVLPAAQELSASAVPGRASSPPRGPQSTRNGVPGLRASPSQQQHLPPQQPLRQQLPHQANQSQLHSSPSSSQFRSPSAPPHGNPSSGELMSESVMISPFSGEPQRPESTYVKASSSTGPAKAAGRGAQSGKGQAVRQSRFGAAREAPTTFVVPQSKELMRCGSEPSVSRLSSDASSPASLFIDTQDGGFGPPPRADDNRRLPGTMEDADPDAAPFAGEESGTAKFVDFLRQYRGAVLRAWRLDLDKLGVGWVSRANFALACRTLGFGSEASSYWATMRPDGNSAPLRFHELDLEESANVEDFARLLWTKAGCGDLDKAWAFLDPGNRTYVTLNEFSRRARGIGFGGNAVLLFRGLDTRGQGQLTRRDLDYLRVLSPCFLQMERSAPSIVALSAWVREELGGVQVLLEKLGLGPSSSPSSSPGGGSGSGDTSVDGMSSSTPSLVAGELAARLKALGFPGDCLNAAVLAARSSGGAGTRVSADRLRSMLAGRPPARSLPAAGGNAAAPAKETPAVDSPVPLQQHRTPTAPPRRMDWDSSVGATDRANCERPPCLRQYFSTPERHLTPASVGASSPSQAHAPSGRRHSFGQSCSSPGGSLQAMRFPGRGGECAVPNVKPASALQSALGGERHERQVAVMSAAAPAGPRARPGDLPD